MDTSQKYINMCEFATALQDFWREEKSNRSKGDFYLDDELDSIVVLGVGVEWIPDSTVWLPRQDQLQERLLYLRMAAAPLVPGNTMPICKVKALYALDVDYLMYIRSLIPRRFESFEQCWLAYYMQAVYNLTWLDDEGVWEPCL